MSNILLIEPNYKNKYPPIGLMKISTYHKMKGDNVSFVKGISKNAIEKVWDRVYITTLFTFYFDITVKTIRFYKNAVLHVDNIFVGGIMASLMQNELISATGIKNIISGQLDSDKKIGYKDDINIDILPLDYDILDDIEYKYPSGDNYFAYTTRGCPNKCRFCAVPILEPVFKTTNNIIKQINSISDRYGDKKDLLLLDNNILYSNDLKKIINDIKKLGFLKKPTYISPIPIYFYIDKIINQMNVNRYYEKSIMYLFDFRKRIKSSEILTFYDSVFDEIVKSEDRINTLLNRIELLIPIIEKYKSKAPKQRYVDFNQGLDARLLSEEKIKILSELPINPLRIAFDNITQSKIYEKAVKMANKYGFKEISNYILYNYNDKPEHLWMRLYLNKELKRNHKIEIFSFPMKYIPIYNKNRDYIGKYWNKKFIRAIQSILLVKKGIVSTTLGFFEKAFGQNLNDFLEILMMPEDFIIYRNYFEEKLDLTGKWLHEYRSLNNQDRKLLLETIKYNKINLIENQYYSENIKKILKYYEMKRTY